MKKLLMVLSLISICFQASAMGSGPKSTSLFYKLGSAYATLKANPLRTLGNAGLTIGRYGVCMSGGAYAGAVAGASLGAEAIINRSNSDSLIGFPIATGLIGGVFGTGVGILCAYKSKKIFSSMQRFGSQVKTDFRNGSKQD